MIREIKKESANNLFEVITEYILILRFPTVASLIIPSPEKKYINVIEYIVIIYQ
jgi:hypothetical protein